jgi:hypothetical protein
MFQNFYPGAEAKNARKFTWTSVFTFMALDLFEKRDAFSFEEVV